MDGTRVLESWETIDRFDIDLSIADQLSIEEMRRPRGFIVVGEDDEGLAVGSSEDYRRVIDLLLMESL